MAQKSPKKTQIFKKLHDKYRLVLMNDDTYEEKVSFRLTRFNVFLAFGTLSIFLVIATAYLIAFTPLREYIPGYGDFNTRQVIRELNLRTDSLERTLIQKDLYLLNIRNILEGREIVTEMPDTLLNPTGVIRDRLPRSPEDSLLRLEMADLPVSAPIRNSPVSGVIQSAPISFFPPMQGMVTSYFDPAQGHLGIDLVGNVDETIKAAMGGTVVFADWTLQTGNTVVIHHPNNIITVYKHARSLFVQKGSKVQIGEPIGIVGNTGTLSMGTHLHFELWITGIPVNPLNHIVF